MFRPNASDDSRPTNSRPSRRRAAAGVGRPNRTRRDDAPPRATGDGARRSALLPTGPSLDCFGLFDRSRSGRSGVVRGSLFAFGRRRVPRRRTRRGRAERALVLVLRLRLLGPSRGPSRGRPRTRPGTRRPRPGSVPVPGVPRRAGRRRRSNCSSIGDGAALGAISRVVSSRSHDQPPGGSHPLEDHARLADAAARRRGVAAVVALRHRRRRSARRRETRGAERARGVRVGERVEQAGGGGIRDDDGRARRRTPAAAARADERRGLAPERDEKRRARRRDHARRQAGGRRRGEDGGEGVVLLRARVVVVDASAVVVADRRGLERVRAVAHLARRDDALERERLLVAERDARRGDGARRGVAAPLRAARDPRGVNRVPNATNGRNAHAPSPAPPTTPPGPERAAPGARGETRGAVAEPGKARSRAPPRGGRETRARACAIGARARKRGEKRSQR